VRRSSSVPKRSESRSPRLRQAGEMRECILEIESGEEFLRLERLKRNISAKTSVSHAAVPFWLKGPCAVTRCAAEPCGSLRRSAVFPNGPRSRPVISSGTVFDRHWNHDDRHALYDFATESRSRASRLKTRNASAVPTSWRGSITTRITRDGCCSERFLGYLTHAIERFPVPADAIH